MTNIISRPHTETEEPHWIEWVTGVVSSVLVIAIVAWVAYEAITEEKTPPDLGISMTKRSPVEGGYRIEFDIANKATTTAAAVTVRGEILEGGAVVEDADVTFDYVPAQSKSSGAILFSQDPGNRQVRIRAVGYTDP
ncbi:TIGR02588 family protein [Rhizobium terrae]|uniref:TIGR02588 family protein n=1 Tax=Rhizobium terrae TaxID=2171756 RepID=UPI000E3D510A|nr:TIGR02588 family protein [Rhizobium terrae]